MNTDESTTEYKQNNSLDELADESGLAIILADETSPALSKSNNNSMCEILYNSEEFASACDKYCGRAFSWATQAGKTVGYKCYAGLNCLATPFENENKPLVAIIGRAFTKADDYRNATARAIEGDWRQFPANEFFDNVLLSNSNENLEKLARRVADLGFGVSDAEFQTSKQTGEERQTTDQEENSKSETPNPRSQHWRSLLSSLLDMSYRQACFLILQFVADRYAVEHLAWLERRDNRLEMIFAKGDLKKSGIQLSIPADDERLFEAAKTETSLELRERQTDEASEKLQTIRLFPISVGGDIRSALVIGGATESDKIKGKEKPIARLCRNLASDLEILRLRELLAKRGLLARAVGQFNESLKSIDSEDFWTQLTNISAELLKAERSSLLVYDEKTDAFVAKAATGIKSDFIKKAKGNLGDRVAKNVLVEGAAAVVEDVGKISLQPAPADWQYKSDSFISYPIVIGNRKIGVLNLTDRADGDIYSNFDLELLDAIVPQLAVAIDRAELKHKAGEFEQLSLTDALTGLLNRRYLEERLTEEIKRSNRHKFPLSFMMIDVDNFKSYNDSFGHTEGDRALQIVGNCLKENLRGADVAARYGGEEFSILLPQTNSSEAIIIGNRVRKRVETEFFPNRQVTISIGIASNSLSLNTARFAGR